MKIECNPTRIVLISNCDDLAWIAAAPLFSTNESWEIVGVVRTKVGLIKRIRLLMSAISNGSFYYAAYMQIEILAAKILMICSKSGGSGFCRHIKSSNISAIDTNNVNDKRTVKFIVDKRPDLVISLRPSHIFKSKTINDIPKIVNLHCSRLPWYGGIGGVLQALAAGDLVLGTSLHFIDNEKIDSGPILSQRLVPVINGRSVLWHTVMLYFESSKLLAEMLLNFNHVTCTSNVAGIGSYNSWPGKLALINLHKRGFTMCKITDFFIGEYLKSPK